VFGIDGDIRVGREVGRKFKTLGGDLGGLGDFDLLGTSKHRVLNQVFLVTTRFPIKSQKSSDIFSFKQQLRKQIPFCLMQCNIVSPAHFAKPRWFHWTPMSRPQSSSRGLIFIEMRAVALATFPACDRRIVRILHPVVVVGWNGEVLFHRRRNLSKVSTSRSGPMSPSSKSEYRISLTRFRTCLRSRRMFSCMSLFWTLAMSRSGLSWLGFMLAFP